MLADLPDIADKAELLDADADAEEEEAPAEVSAEEPATAQPGETEDAPQGF